MTETKNEENPIPNDSGEDAAAGAAGDAKEAAADAGEPAVVQEEVAVEEGATAAEDTAEDATESAVEEGAAAEDAAEDATVEGAEAAGDGATEDGQEGDGDEDAREAIEALRKLSDRLFARMCRRLPMRTFVSELQRIDRAVYFRYFKGYRPVKINAQRVEKVLRRECLEKENGLLAQLVIYNWDEAEYRLYGALQKHVKAINEDVEAIERITPEEADPILDALEGGHDRRDVCIATLINGVRVSDEYLAERYGDLL